MTKLYGVLIVMVVLWVGYRVFVYWEKVSAEKEPVVEVPLVGEMLRGMAYRLETSYQSSKQNASTLKKWLAQNENSEDLKDPRKAWIELDYVLLVARENPGEAKRVFAEVKARVDKTSPLYNRVQKMSATYE